MSKLKKISYAHLRYRRGNIIIIIIIIHNIYSYAFLICYRFLLTMAVNAEIKDILIHIADTQST